MGAVEEIRRPPSTVLVAASQALPLSAGGALDLNHLAESSPWPPDVVLKGFRTGLVDNLTALLGHLGVLVSTGVTKLADHPRLALALTRDWVTQLAGGSKGEALARQTLGRVNRLVVVVLAPTLPALLVTVGIEALGHIALTWPTHRVTPPVGWAGLLGLPLTVSATQQRRVTLTPVSVVRARVPGTRGVTLAWVEVTHVITRVTHVARVTLTRVLVPGLAACGVVRTLGLGDTRVEAVTASDHAVLQLGAQVIFRVSADPNILKTLT